jgi:hypothetical protein
MVVFTVNCERSPAAPLQHRSMAAASRPSRPKERGLLLRPSHAPAWWLGWKPTEVSGRRSAASFQIIGHSADKRTNLHSLFAVRVCTAAVPVLYSTVAFPREISCGYIKIDRQQTPESGGLAGSTENTDGRCGLLPAPPAAPAAVGIPSQWRHAPTGRHNLPAPPSRRC